jgi:hypothetical protein
VGRTAAPRRRYDPQHRTLPFTPLKFAVRFTVGQVRPARARSRRARGVAGASFGPAGPGSSSFFRHRGRISAKEYYVLFEVLENRRLMAAQVSLVNGTLNIQGDGSNEYAGVVENTDTGALEVTVGDDGGNQPTLQFDIDDVEGIFIDLADGEGTVDLTVHTLPAIVRTGSGFDLISVVNYNTDEAVAVSSGGDTDLLSVTDFGTYGTAVMGGDGDDGIKIFAASTNDVRPTLAFGGDGADFLEGPGFYQADDIETLEDETVYDPGTGFTHLYGDRDDDTFMTYNADTRITGGSGMDVATMYLDALQKVKLSSIQDLEIVVVS